jgi:hypothetical protein
MHANMRFHAQSQWQHVQTHAQPAPTHKPLMHPLFCIYTHSHSYIRCAAPPTTITPTACGPAPTVLARLLVEVSVEGPVLAQALGAAVVALLHVHLAAQAQDALNGRLLLGVDPAVLRGKMQRQGGTQGKPVWVGGSGS